eukprot:1459784-Amphidinium_carterae.1
MSFGLCFPGFRAVPLPEQGLIEHARATNTAKLGKFEAPPKKGNKCRPQEVSSEFLATHYYDFFESLNVVLRTADYIAQRQSLKLLSEILLDRNFTKVRTPRARPTEAQVPKSVSACREIQDLTSSTVPT